METGDTSGSKKQQLAEAFVALNLGVKQSILLSSRKDLTIEN
jgi:hypothetical protein